VRNAFNAAMVAELSQALANLAALPADRLRLLLLAGEGPAFCAGADLAAMQAQGAAGPEQNLAQARELERLFRALAGFPAPVLAYVQGVALGGGLGLCACADFVLAEPDAAFATPEVRLGLAPAVIGPYLARRLGLARAAPLMLGGLRLEAREALALGLVQRLVAPEEGAEAALTRLLREFLAGAPNAARATKALLLRIAPLPDQALAEASAATLADLRAAAEAQRGLHAFFQKTSPPWDLEGNG
jgi:methylglutaconyl-CoA hydratase